MRPRNATKTLVVLAIATPLAVVVSGCQTYTPKPLDPAAAQQALAVRSAASAEVAQFIERMATIDTTAVPGDFDPANGISLAEAEVVAMVFNPELRLARLQAGVAKATADTAGIWDDPVTGINVNDVFQKAATGFSVGAEIGLTIPISGRLDAEKARAGSALAAQLVQVEAAEWNTRMRLRRAWATWTTTQQRTLVVQQTADAVTQIATIADRMEAAGEMPRVEARLFRIERATAAAELSRLRTQVAEELLALKRIMGIAPWASVDLVPADLPAPPPLDLDTLRAEMIARNPALAAQRAAYETAERALAVEIRKQYPDIEIGPSYNTDGNEDFTFGVRLPLPLWNHNQQGVAVADAERELERARFETALELHLSDLQSAAIGYQGAAEQHRTIADEIVPLLEEQAADNRRITELGEVNTLLLLDSLTRQQAVRLSLIEARRAEWLAHIQLTTVVGPVPRVPAEAAPAAATAESDSPSARNMP